MSRNQSVTIPHETRAASLATRQTGAAAVGVSTDAAIIVGIVPKPSKKEGKTYDGFVGRPNDSVVLTGPDRGVSSVSPDSWGNSSWIASVCPETKIGENIVAYVVTGHHREAQDS